MASRRIYRRLMMALVSVLLVLGVLFALYGIRLHASAKALVNSAREIHTTADAERQIRAWSGIPFVEVVDEKPNRFGDHNYSASLTNTVFRWLRLVPPTLLGATVIMHAGELRSIVVVMWTGWDPSTTSGVWVQEWFDPRASGSFHVGQGRRPWSATVEFASGLPEPQRAKAFGLNADCLVRLGGCKGADDILPGVWQLGTAPK